MRNNADFQCTITLYILADRAVMPTIARAEDGFYIDSEPVYEFDYSNLDALVNALSEAASRGNPKIQHPSQEQIVAEGLKVGVKNGVAERYTDSKSWTALEKKSICITIEVWRTFYALTVWGRASNGTWGDAAHKIEIPFDQGIIGLSHAIIDHLRTRTDLPGLRLAQTA
jgi:hypothetical protein